MDSQLAGELALLMEKVENAAEEGQQQQTQNDHHDDDPPALYTRHAQKKDKNTRVKNNT